MKVEETPAYHDTFEVVTPSYRAPELVYGTDFGCPIDMWATAITLAELFCGHSLFSPASRGGLAVQMATLLGQPPPALFGRAKYATELRALVADMPAALEEDQIRQRLGATLGASPSQEHQLFIDMLSRILRCDATRRSAARAPPPDGRTDHPPGCLAHCRGTCQSYRTLPSPTRPTWAHTPCPVLHALPSPTRLAQPHTPYLGARVAIRAPPVLPLPRPLTGMMRGSA